MKQKQSVMGLIPAAEETFSSVQSLSRVQLYVTPWTAARQVSLSVTNSWSLLKLMCIELVMPSNHLIFCHPLLLPPSIFPSIRVFSKKSVLWIKWQEYWSFNFTISPSNEYSVLISFRIDWFDLCAVQGTLKSLLQHHSSKALVLWHSVANLFLYWFARWLCLESTLCARHSVRQWGYSLEKQRLCSKGAHVPVKEGDRKQVSEIILDSDLLRKEKQEDLCSSGF